MPRNPRASLGRYCYHALNRGNARRTVFFKDGDFAAFVKLLRQAGARSPVRLLAWCLMPNHFHLALWPPGDGDLSDYMGWLLTAHVRRYHQHYHSSGHVYRRAGHVLSPAPPGSAKKTENQAVPDLTRRRPDLQLW
jgi:putative transposase